MKKILTTALLLAIIWPSYAYKPELNIIKLDDGQRIMTRVCVPDGKFNTLVVCIHDAGPQTYLGRTENYNFYDELAEGFCGQGLAFFTYNRRGVEISENGPDYYRVDREKYNQYNPNTEAEDIEKMIKWLKKDRRFSECRVVLYGIGEGTITATIIADRKKENINGLLLQGYAHENMYDIIAWQNSGESIMKKLLGIFDKDGNGTIDRTEFNDVGAREQKEYFFGDSAFEEVDTNRDGVIDIKDIAEIRKAFHEVMMDMIETGDDEWLREYYMDLPVSWFRSHFGIEPNKTRIMRINIQIIIVHGKDDGLYPASALDDLALRNKAMGKENYTSYCISDHDHLLNFTKRATDKEWSDGYKLLFRKAKEFTYVGQVTPYK